MIQRRAGAVNGEGFIFTAVGFNEQVGDTLVVHVATAGIATSVTDNAGNVFQMGPSLSDGSMTDYIFYSENVKRAGTLIEVHLNGFYSTVVAVEAYTGVSNVGNTGKSSGNSNSPFVDVTTQDSNNVVAVCGASRGPGGSESTLWSSSSPVTVWNQDNVVDTPGWLFIAGIDGGIVVSPGDDHIAASISSAQSWVMLGLELRS